MRGAVATLAVSGHGSPQRSLAGQACGGEIGGDSWPVAGAVTRMAAGEADPAHSRASADLFDLSLDGRLLAVDGDRPAPHQDRQDRRSLRLKSQQRARRRRYVASASQPLSLSGFRGRGGRLDLQAEIGRSAYEVPDQ